MNPKALKSLEYYKIIDQLTEKASSQMGKKTCAGTSCPLKMFTKSVICRPRPETPSHAFSRKETSPLEA